MSEELKTNLADNAFDFLKTAIEQFDEEPKYSIINFATAVELFLKLVLLDEHWSLICNSPTRPNLSALKDGSARTINFSDIMPKIESVTDYKFSKDMKKCFEEIARHRNQIVHFYHVDSLDDKEKEKFFIQELMAGWRHLQKLITEDWRFTFNDGIAFGEEILHINELMKKNAKFLKQKYTSIELEIQEDKRKGIAYIKCPICEYDALRVVEEPDVPKKQYLGYNVCKVCNFSQSFIQIPCPDSSCNEIIELKEGKNSISIDETTCPKCKKDITIGHIQGLLETRTEMEIRKACKDGDDVGYANCSFCDNVKCVINVDDSHICSNCITVTDDIYQCDRCGIWQNSYTDSGFGCDTCAA